MSTDAKAETRARILEAAHRLLVERGYHGVGVEEIARAAGVSRQALYQHHFKSKSELFVAMVAHSDGKVGVPQRAKRVLEAATALEALDAMVETMVTIDGEVRKIAQVIESARQSDEAAETTWQNRMRSRAGFVKTVIGRLAQEGRLAPEWTVDDAADLVWALISPSTYRALVLDRQWPPQRFIARVKQMLHESLVRKPRRARR